ncbi:response regulator [Alteromonas pelagimontana]|uniref:Response regulator n=1 Tax=Alteromonas pelagimontana TaxID=1858656 RepID=A0A6M4M9I7_9ALTE|nr:response regulator [Alteromonas pelagimontana]QJR79787.1 response regulator [Alteromonas pelagimontana]
MNKKLARQAKVLIVDDHVLAKGYLKYSMEELGFEDIHYVDKTSQALTALSNHYYDLIICAYDLKHEQEGYFLYDQLKEHKALPPSTAFVFVSADTTADIVHSIVELQPDEFLAKPFTVRELDKRLSRVLLRKHALKPVYQLIEKNQPENALDELESFLTEPKNAEFFPLALKTKGELLLACDFYDQGKEFYQAIINVQNFTWAQLGLVRCLIHLGENDEAEKRVLRLAFQPDSMLTAYDLLSALQVKLQEFEDALESVTIASEMSPRNLRRHRIAMTLSRITHDYASQFEAAKRIVKFAKNSVHDKPENYLNVARAGIDFAMTADEAQTSALIKQANDYLRQLKTMFPKADVDDQMKVINARLLYLQDESDNAKALLGQLSSQRWESDGVEGLLDKAKAFHEVGLHEHALSILDVIEKRCISDPAINDLFLHYIQQEKTEKAEILLSPKTLNSTAVEQYHQGDLSQALETFRHAFIIMPKNAAIALNLLQATAIMLRDKKRSLEDVTVQRTIYHCVKAVEAGKLNLEQEKRYERIRSTLKDFT